MTGPVLRDIHVPSAAWWPLASGWWLVAAVVVLLAIGGLWWMRRRMHRRPYAAALYEIDALAAAFARNGDTVELADGASRLLRRVARKIDPVVASRSGEAWRAFVQAHAHHAAARAVLDDLLDARFRASLELDAPALCAALRVWCRSALRRSGAPRLAGAGEIDAIRANRVRKASA
ncbi:MAG: DUF4381 domain-containing protein [Rhodanobacteraceae bacterium]